ncbi:MAG TPA: selenide, water dikinase SelD [Solirubrobacteraceae bacterium]|jgi:selenide,water dikinase|nr:selenide, water dikinase SelD [Solirubrobacteraceae bacterium]
MNVRVRLFAILRERAGADSVELQLPAGARVSDALEALSRHERLRGVLERLPVQLAVNREYARPATTLHEGDELALIPPVSGGAGASTQAARAPHVRVGRAPLSAAALSRAVRDPRAGAVVTFEGVTREVAMLDYEAYDAMAAKRIERILCDCIDAHALLAAAAEHRTGAVPLGEASVVVAVSAAHRDEAFAGAREAIDRIKAEAPIWKRELDRDGAARWVQGSPPPAISRAASDARAGTALSALSSGAGCGCKLPPQALFEIVAGLPTRRDPRLLVGAATGDDAAVVSIGAGLALVHTIDFFTSPVDDPYEFGRIAAANALSDIYAMGAKPLSALNVVAFPLRELGEEVLRAVLRGGADVVAQAGAMLAGGHSIEDSEPKYGLAVTGLVSPDRVVTNAGGRDGDALVLSKPLGVGAIVGAARRGAVDDGLLASAVATMVALNDTAADAALAAGVHAMTDVTGFGLLGHLHHVCRESGLAAEIDAAAVPSLEGVQPLLGQEHGMSGGSRRNAAWAQGFARFDDDVPAWRRRLLVDATTSGGLLAAVPEAAAERAGGAIIGRLLQGTAGTIRVRSSR